MKLKHYFIALIVLLGFLLIPNTTRGNTGKTTSENLSIEQSGLRKVKGVIKDEYGEPLPGVSIVLKGTQTAAMADADGNFAIEFPANTNKPILIYSYVGMKPIERAVTSDEVSITMTEEAMLKEVYVTGIFNKPKESYTGAASLIRENDLKMASSQSVLSGIQNIDPSFKILSDVGNGSDPNKLPDINIRGASNFPVEAENNKINQESLRAANQPLFILNGFEISFTRFNDIDKDQIESITILKDASSTALYGTKGSNGVIVVTTKRPEKGRIRISYKGTLEIEAPDLTSYNMMNSYEKLIFEKVAGRYTGSDNTSQEELDDLYNARMSDVARGVDTYWLKYPVRTGVGSLHSLTLGGGDDKMLYEAAVSYRNKKGAMKGSDRNSFNGRVNLMYKLKNIQFENNLQVGNTKAYNSPYGSFNQYARINPYFKPYGDDGNLLELVEEFKDYRISPIINPLYNALLPSKDQNEYLNVRNDFSINWNVYKDLSLKAMLSMETQKDRSDLFISPDNTKFRGYAEIDADKKGEYKYTSGNLMRYSLRTTASYNKIFNERHQIFLGTGFTIEETKEEEFHSEVVGILSGSDFFGSAQQYKDKAPYAYESVTRSVGLLFNGNYTYDSRYYLDVSGKYDGSSQFGSKNRFAPIWSVGTGWNITNEKFFKDRKPMVLDYAQLRASYGVTGSQSFNPYMARLTFDTALGKGYQSQYGLILKNLGNSDLKWQKTNQWNAGLNVLMFDGRLSLKADVYKRITDGMISKMSIPSAGGFSEYTANIGKVNNTGFEIDANYVILTKSNGLYWSVGGTLRHNKNKVAEISSALEIRNGEIAEAAEIDPSMQIREGLSINTIYAVPSKGIDPGTGREIYIKRDGTETFDYDPRDQVANGSKDDKIWGTVNTSLRFKGFTFTAYFSYKYGANAYNTTLASKVENIDIYYNVDKRAYYDRWKQPGDIAQFKSVQDQSETKPTDRFIMKNNSFSCSSLSLAYDVPTDWSRKYLYSSYVMVKVQMEDIFHIESIKRERGTSYPFSRNFSFSLTANF